MDKTDILNEYLNNFDYFSFDLPPQRRENARFYILFFSTFVYICHASNVAYYYYYFCYEEGLPCTLMYVYIYECTWQLGGCWVNMDDVRGRESFVICTETYN